MVDMFKLKYSIFLLKYQCLYLLTTFLPSKEISANQLYTVGDPIRFESINRF